MSRTWLDRYTKSVESAFFNPHPCKIATPPDHTSRFSSLQHVIEKLGVAWGRGMQSVEPALLSLWCMHKLNMMAFQGWLVCAISIVLASIAGLPSRAQSDDFDLTYRKLYPCQETSLPDSNVSLYSSHILAVQANLTYCNSSTNISNNSVCLSK